MVNHFHERVRLLRRLAAKSARETARAAGFPAPTQWSLLESSGRDPRLSTILRVAQAFGVNIEWLATGGGPAFRLHPDLDLRSRAGRKAAAAIVQAALAAAANDNAAASTEAA